MYGEFGNYPCRRELKSIIKWIICIDFRSHFDGQIRTQRCVRGVNNLSRLQYMYTDQFTNDCLFTLLLVDGTPGFFLSTRVLSHWLRLDDVLVHLGENSLQILTFGVVKVN